MPEHIFLLFALENQKENDVTYYFLTREWHVRHLSAIATHLHGDSAKNPLQAGHVSVGSCSTDIRLTNSDYARS